MPALLDRCARTHGLDGARQVKVAIPAAAAVEVDAAHAARLGLAALRLNQLLLNGQEVHCPVQQGAEVAVVVHANDGEVLAVAVRVVLLEGHKHPQRGGH
jgi:hypothetical protein